MTQVKKNLIVVQMIFCPRWPVNQPHSTPKIGLIWVIFQCLLLSLGIIFFNSMQKSDNRVLDGFHDIKPDQDHPHCTGIIRCIPSLCIKFATARVMKILGQCLPFFLTLHMVTLFDNYCIINIIHSLSSLFPSGGGHRLRHCGWDAAAEGPERGGERARQDGGVPHHRGGEPAQDHCDKGTS